MVALIRSSRLHSFSRSRSVIGFWQSIKHTICYSLVNGYFTWKGELWDLLLQPRSQECSVEERNPPPPPLYHLSPNFKFTPIQPILTGEGAFTDNVFITVLVTFINLNFVRKSCKARLTDGSIITVVRCSP